jgi:hypothetical protein
LAAITFNTVHQADHGRGRLQPVLAVLHATLDSFVSYRMRRAAAEAEQVCPRHVRGDVIAIEKTRNDRHAIDKPRPFAKGASTLDGCDRS